MCISKSRRKNSSTVELIASFSHFLRDFIGNSKVFPAFLEPSTTHCKKKKFQTSSCANGRHSSRLLMIIQHKSDKTDHEKGICVMVYPLSGIKRTLEILPKPPSFIMNQRLIEVAPVARWEISGIKEMLCLKGQQLRLNPTGWNHQEIR